MKNYLKQKIIKLRNKNKHLAFGKGANIAADARFEGYNKIGEDSVFSGSIGRYSYIGKRSSVSAEIGRYCSIAGAVNIISGTHPVKNWVSTHPAFYSPACECGKSYVNSLLFEENTPRTVIGNDVWIGAGAVILGGIKIGDGAIIAAGAVVTKDVEPYAIAGGVPAKLIRYRFEEAEIEKLLEIRWWDKPEEWIAAHAAEFSDIKRFLEQCEK